MKKIVIRGPARLSGEVVVSGSKNAALPILFATILTEGVSEIYGLPDIGDTRVALEILSSFGADIKKLGGTTYIDTRTLRYNPPEDHLVSKIRASTYLIGSCLSRFGKCRLAQFGGCNFASRPIDMHLDACRILGAEVLSDSVTTKGLRGGKIIFTKPSVGATVNAILLASRAFGETTIFGYAKEPHIDSLIDFLVSAGAEINKTPEALRIAGKKLHGGKITVIGDMIEAGTYLAAGLITRGNVRVRGCPACEMDSAFNAFSSLGAEIMCDGDAFSLKAPEKSNYVKITAAPYPEFPTDLQPIFAPLLARFGGGEIHDTVWQTRFGYLDELAKFGVRSRREYASAFVEKSIFLPAHVSAPDLRGGMACLLSALVCEGESTISLAETLLRGYEDLTEKLGALGAELRIEDIQ